MSSFHKKEETFTSLPENNVRSSGFPKKIFSSSFSQFPVKFQLKSEQGWIFFMQKLQLYSGQGDCMVNKLLKQYIKSSNFTVNKSKIAEGTIIHAKSYNYIVNKTT